MTARRSNSGFRKKVGEIKEASAQYELEDVSVLQGYYGSTEGQEAGLVAGRDEAAGESYDDAEM